MKEILRYIFMGIPLVGEGEMKQNDTELKYSDNIKANVIVEIPHDKFCRYSQSLTYAELVNCPFYEMLEDGSNWCHLFSEYLKSLDEYSAYVIKCDKCLKLKEIKIT